MSYCYTPCPTPGSARYPFHRLRTGLIVVEEDAGDVLPLELIRQHCEVDPIDGTSDVESHPDDILLRTAMEDAVAYAEEFTGLSIVRRTYEMALDGFPYGNGLIELPVGPLIEIVDFRYADSSDGEIDPALWTIDAYRTPARIVALGSWPSVDSGSNNIRVRFRAGYLRAEEVIDSDGPTSDQENAPRLPRNIRRALLLLISHYFDNPADAVEKPLTAIQHGVDALLRQASIRLGIA